MSVYLILRAIVGYTSHVKLFLMLCIQFVLCMECQFMKKKWICHRAQFCIISHGISAFGKFSEKPQVLYIKLKYL